MLPVAVEVFRLELKKVRSVSGIVRRYERHELAGLFT